MAERDPMRLLLVAPIALAMLAAVAIPAVGSAPNAAKLDRDATVPDLSSIEAR